MLELRTRRQKLANWQVFSLRGGMVGRFQFLGYVRGSKKRKGSLVEIVPFLTVYIEYKNICVKTSDNANNSIMLLSESILIDFLRIFITIDETWVTLHTGD